MSIPLILDELERINGKLDRILAWGRRGVGLTTKETQSLRKLEKEWEDDENDALKVSKTTTLHSPGFDDYKPEEKTNFALPMTGKYQWYNLVNHEGKVRKCENEGCGMFLMYNNDKKTYEHWKYDPNTGKGGYVADRCEGVYNG